MPIGLTASGKDTSVPPQSVLRLATSLQAQGRVLLIYREERGHDTSYADAKSILAFALEHARKIPKGQLNTKDRTLSPAKVAVTGM